MPEFADLQQTDSQDGLMEAPLMDSEMGLTSYQDPQNHQGEPCAPHDIEQWIAQYLPYDLYKSYRASPVGVIQHVFLILVFFITAVFTT